MANFSYQQYQLKTGTDVLTIPYRLYVPEGSGPFPVLLCLHGAGERGDDNESQLPYFLAMFEDKNSPVYDAIVAVPQCPADRRWVDHDWSDGNYEMGDSELTPYAKAAIMIVNEICHNYPVDTDRLYITGLSMGGFGTWDLLARFSTTFAAGLPICGGGAVDMAKEYARIPIRTFHSTDDPAVPYTGTAMLAREIEKHSPVDFAYTQWDGMGHDIWKTVYRMPEVIRWLFGNRKQ